jgi:hypothetical protein
MMPEVRVLLGASPPAVPPDEFERVEEIWRNEKVRRGDALFNGQLFSVQYACSSSIIGCLAEYKFFLAQRRDPSLWRALCIRPLAVQGVLLCADGVVFGLRADHVEQDAGQWELVPSGAIDGSTRKPDGSIDLVQHVLVELVEETGIGAVEMKSPPRAFAMVNDADTHVSDVGFILRTSLSKVDVMIAFASLENREYVALEIIPIAQLAEFIKSRGQTLTRVSSEFLGAARPLLKS